MKTNTNNSMLPTWLRRTAAVLAIVVGLHGLSPLSYGRPIMSTSISTEDARTADLATIQQMLEQKVVQHRLEELGFTKDEIQSRLALASNAELHQLASQSDQLMAGGSVLIAVLVIVLLVLLILRIVANESESDPDILIA